MAYVLADSSEFVGCDLLTFPPQLQVFTAPNREVANPWSDDFEASSLAQYTELKVFNGTIKGTSLTSLVQRLYDQKLRVNRDGYCYIQVPGTPGNPPVPSQFFRLNDLFPWSSYVINPSTFDSTPSTIWNRRSSGNNAVIVDYSKLHEDLKQAMKDKKELEEDKKDLREDKKQANRDKNNLMEDLSQAFMEKNKLEEDLKDKNELEAALKQAQKNKNKLEAEKNKLVADLKGKKELEAALKQAEKDKNKLGADLKQAQEDKDEQERHLNATIDKIKDNWKKAMSIGARPLPSDKLNVQPANSSCPKRWSARDFISTPTGRVQKMWDSYMDKLTSSRPISVYSSIPRSFETCFWWVVKVVGTRFCNNNTFVIAYYGGGSDNPCTGDIPSSEMISGPVSIPDVGERFCIILAYTGPNNTQELLEQTLDEMARSGTLI